MKHPPGLLVGELVQRDRGGGFITVSEGNSLIVERQLTGSADPEGGADDLKSYLVGFELSGYLIDTD